MKDDRRSSETMKTSRGMGGAGGAGRWGVSCGCIYVDWVVSGGLPFLCGMSTFDLCDEEHI